MKIRHESDAATIIARESETPEVTGQIIVRKLIEPADGADRFVLLIGEYAEGSSAAMHSHDFEHEIYVLDGRLTIDTAGPAPGEISKTPLRRGDAVFIPRGEVHGFSTGPAETARVLVAVPAAAMADESQHGHDHE